ncbi:hypothetical protein TNCV_2083671 [Trichonephila clavipes]|uniref:Uncharacterized protein n=1 Tax=Trichonephila clavipes TaxID=2585209 RepID=A0A8X6RVG1_TRICX|nr:hypothetical protein TNCV_2083671 [Trichonephila clavipes]
MVKCSLGDPAPFDPWIGTVAVKLDLITRWLRVRDHNQLATTTTRVVLELSCIHSKAVSVEHLTNQRLHLGRDEVSDWLNTQR